MSAWKNVENTLENRFRLEKLVFQKIPCDYHATEFHDDCWDCGQHRWITIPFDSSFIAIVDDYGYSPDRNYRFCSNSLGVVPPNSIKSLLLAEQLRGQPRDKPQ